MGKMHRRKGYMGELKARRFFEEKGLRVVWQAEDPKAPDISVNDWQIEVKNREGISSNLWNWKDEKSADALFILKNRHTPLVVITAELFAELIKRRDETEE